jgi:hypothetical protein
MSGIPRPPVTRGGQVDSFELSKWFDSIWKLLSGAAGTAWILINKNGSKLTDIETRPHSQLQRILGADVTNTGQIIIGANTDKHISNEQAYRWDNAASLGDSVSLISNNAQSMAMDTFMQPVQTKRETKPSYEGLYLMGGM